MLGHDADWWNGAVIVGLVIAFAAAGLIAVATYSAIVAQKREAVAAKDALDRYKATVALQVAEAQKEGIEAGKAAAGANAKSAEANQRAAEANERAAEARKKAAEAEGRLAEAEARAAQANERAGALEKDAAVARLEQERLKATLAWRILSASEVEKLGRSLAEHPGTVNLWYPVGDPEALYLALQYGQILEEAHWKVLFAGANMGGIVFGIAVPDADSNGPDTDNLRSALSAAGISFSTDSLPPMGFTIGATKQSASPTLMIGSRKPALFP